MSSTPSAMPSETPEHEPARVLLGVGGGIAAYKAVELLRRLRERGYHVAPVLTRAATEFVAPLTFSALASEPARISLFDDPTTPIPHTYLGQNCDVVVVAPATAHLIARMAVGLADDLLTTTLLATRAPIVICPAMHTEMWEQPSVQANVATLRLRGVLIVGPDEGALAGGDLGAGRLADVAQILDVVDAVVRGFRGPLEGRHVVVSAGGTREAIDPVRVITNRSSGRQGYALAEVAARLGARVTLVTTVDRELAVDVRPRVHVMSVESAREMYAEVTKAFQSADAVLMAAAVADFTLEAAPQKLKRREGLPELSLVPTEDVVDELVRQRRPGQVVVAFAAETSDVMVNASEKLTRKNVDLLVVNDVSIQDVGFEYETNAVTILTRDGHVEEVTLRSKDAIAHAILTRVTSLLGEGVR